MIMWKDLTMKEKAAMMKVAILNGITDLDSIIERYNRFDDGGPKSPLSSEIALENLALMNALTSREDFVPTKSMEEIGEEIRTGRYKGREDKDYSQDPLHKDVLLVQDALNKAAQSIIEGGKVEDAIAREEEYRKEKFYPYKLGIEAGVTGAELLSGSYFLTKAALKGTNAIAKKLSRTTNRYGMPVYNTSSRAGKVRETTDRLLSKMDKGQTTMSTLGMGADVALLLQGDTSLINNLEIAGDVAGIIGGTNIIRSTPWFGRYRRGIDTTLDLLGLGAAGYDIGHYLYNKFDKGGFKDPYKHGDIYKDSSECAYFSNHTLNDLGYMMSGDAWNPRGADLLFSGFEGLDRPLTYNEKDYDKYARGAVSNVYNNFITRDTLDPNEVYTVNMFYATSPNKEKAFNEGSIYGTHTGYLSYEPKDDTWYVTHNIGNRISKERFGDLLNSKGKIGVTAIYRPRRNNFFNRVRTKLGFDEGGFLDTFIS